jgi:hypothetical protein
MNVYILVQQYHDDAEVRLAFSTEELAKEYVRRLMKSLGANVEGSSWVEDSEDGRRFCLDWGRNPFGHFPYYMIERRKVLDDLEQGGVV